MVSSEVYTKLSDRVHTIDCQFVIIAIEKGATHIKDRPTIKFKIDVHHVQRVFVTPHSG